MAIITQARPPGQAPAGPKPIHGEQRDAGKQSLIYLFLLVPMAALAAAVPFAWTTGLLSWTDIAIAVGFYILTLHGVTVGYHRLFTHSSFKPNRAVKVTLAILGSMSVQGPLITWVADHRRHHAFSDKEGDPHSPWLYGTSAWALSKGFWHAHMGWMFEPRNTTNEERFAPDLRKDRDLVLIDKYFWLCTVATFFLPAILGGLITMSWTGALTAFFWGSLVRVAVLHHATWSTNSICHMIGERPFKSRDKAANFWPLALVSGGESWHNSHHADQSCARHGVKRGQIDTSARIIWFLERAGWVTNVKWPTEERLAKLAVD
ncbi:acyl-CoA desaturase [Glycomyces harbinensis]|uniref:Stearoyl-CoA desaturase (Delta-9 desaturase) n=1 Tax=Glycomyces harbinensis TaxID=58114 RepID=A0A1G7DNP5_9ACTN|nr:acyl-CoA desaturase [Glycomyces harbinensis]SDE53122.1 stearoyl-CoA desaturase (delta-9 desaturase) [Glycomyces harbinensis]